MNLLRFQKPSRYINREWNAIHKSGGLKIALCFPDLYEIGMSHLGLKILYEILNSMDGVVAERVFAPWPDMEEYIRNNNFYLRSLESRTPLKDFDIVGFSLQYELSITTVLNMLELGGIAPLRHERTWLPIVIAGGPCTVNPVPFEKFFDAIFVGEAEYSIKELALIVKDWKRNGDGNRESLLKALSEIDGFYVPGINKKVRRVIVPDLNTVPYPVKPVVAHQAIHDRLNIEISRGCPKGCRFCQAGMIYRPTRERTVERILEIVLQSLPNTGYEEVSFTSLSAGDYRDLGILLERFNDLYRDKRIALSLPSLRVGAVRKEILTQLKSVRKTGFTIAPEAATERLRNVINKDFNEEDYERALNILFQEGWLNLKLYFMIGLPTETPEDIEGIINMSLKGLRIAKRYTKRFINISVGISPFIPKPHTPFQWCGQEDLETLKEKARYLKDALEKKGLNYRGHMPEMSLVEAIISRGDDRIGELIYQAWRLGSKLDAWTEFFDFRRWIEAMTLTGIDGFALARAVYDEGFQFPWEVVDTGIEKDFLLREYKKALEQKKTPGCETVCSACGLGCNYRQSEVQEFKGSKLQGFKSSRVQNFKSSKVQEFKGSKAQGFKPKYSTLRVEFSKTGESKYLSHLELTRLIERALRRADVPLQYSEGFHPMPKISFGPALPVGVEGLREYFDMVVDARFLLSGGLVAEVTVRELKSENVSEDGLLFRNRDSHKPVEFLDLKEHINNFLPHGVKLNRVFLISPEIPSLSSFINCYEYVLKFKGQNSKAVGIQNLKAILKSFPESLKPHLLNLGVVENGLKVLLIEQKDKKIKLMELTKELISALLETGILERSYSIGEDIEIIRTGLYGLVEGKILSPIFEVVQLEPLDSWTI